MSPTSTNRNIALICAATVSESFTGAGLNANRILNLGTATYDPYGMLTAPGSSTAPTTATTSTTRQMIALPRYGLYKIAIQSEISAFLANTTSFNLSLALWDSGYEDTTFGLNNEQTIIGFPNSSGASTTFANHAHVFFYGVFEAGDKVLLASNVGWGTSTNIIALIDMVVEVTYIGK